MDGAAPPFLALLGAVLLAAVLLLGEAPARCAALNPRMLFLVKPDPIVLRDHGGALLTGNLTVNVLFYGRFTAAQRAIVADFVRSVSAAAPAGPGAKGHGEPSVASWWRTTSLYRGGGARLRLGRQILDERMSLGRSLSLGNVTALARAAGHHRGAITPALCCHSTSTPCLCPHIHVAGVLLVAVGRADFVIVVNHLTPKHLAVGHILPDWKNFVRLHSFSRRSISRQ